MRANGFHYDAVKIFCWKDGKVTKVPYRKYVIPDVTAGIFWFKNRDPEHWRDVQQLQSEVGHCILSDRPMSEEQWIAERTKVIDAKPNVVQPLSDCCRRRPCRSTVNVWLMQCVAPAKRVVSSSQAATATPRSTSLALASWTLSSSAERFRLSRRKIAALA
jgi:hypothetical protein